MIHYKGKQHELLPLLVTDVHTNARMCVAMYADNIPTHVCAYKCTYKIKADSTEEFVTQSKEPGNNDISHVIIPV